MMGCQKTLGAASLGVLVAACGAGDPAPTATEAAPLTKSSEPGRPPGPAGPPPGPNRPHPVLPAAAEDVRTNPEIQGPEASVSGRIPLLNQPPKEALVGDGTLWIRGTVPGVSVGQVRFHSSEEPGGPLQVICLEEIIDGRFEAEAPPSGPDVYVSVVALPDGKAAEDPQPWGALASPLALGGVDHGIAVEIGDRADWTARLRVPPDRIVGVGDVSPR